MDTSKLDATERQHLAVYRNFIGFSKISIVLTVIVLSLMAIFLL